MGKNIGIAEALFSKTQQRLYGLLFGHPDRTYFLRELIEKAKIGRGTVQREMEKLVASELVLVKKVGNQKHYQANKGSPVFEELASILRKTTGIVDVIADALKPLAGKIKTAFVFGSVARGSETTGSDIDLLIIGEVNFKKIVTSLYDAQETLQREINPKVYKKEEWMQLIRKKDAFAKEVMAGQKLIVLGSLNEFK
jgi:predicted nucleotidyltransferase